ncbi:hypothetical protein NIES4071_49240 [Calothrix sp. NIES-4071]|nr:hypothetical protein NIES4071_49240 [Calothrix sp. NIES-4071]BAZ59235.1 hypothetical protein NIES4105_49180 [Calothrix sp. NIES-4105]
MSSHLETSLLIGSAPLPDSNALQTEQAGSNSVDDPLIAKGWENTSYAGIILLVFLILGAVGLFSRRIEYVIIVALFFSLLFIGFILVAR